MSVVPLTYRSTRTPVVGEAARSQAFAPAPAPMPAARTASDAEGRSHHQDRGAENPRRSPLVRALMRSLEATQQGPTAGAMNDDSGMERALMAFASALKQSLRHQESSDLDMAYGAQPHSAQTLLDAFADLQQAMGRSPNIDHSVLEEQLSAFLDELARHFNNNVSADDATQPGSLISVQA